MAPMNIQTTRFVLVPATAELVGLEITGPEALSRALSARVPANWPPEQVVDALPWFQEQLTSTPALCGWLGWYGLCRTDADPFPLLVGSAGFFGLPKNGIVEVGYSVLPQFQGQGYATEIVGGLVAWALAQPAVQRVAAEANSENGASLRVLEKLDFLPVGTGREAGHIHFEKRESEGNEARRAHT